MQDWFHDILEHLYNTYPLDHSFHDVNDFLEAKLKIDNVNGNSLHRLSAILYILKEKSYIDGAAQNKDSAELGRGQVLGLYVTGYNARNSLLTHRVEIRLTIDGYVYMQNREMKLKEHESQISTQKSTRTINKLFYVTLAVAILGAFAQLGNFYINYHKEPNNSLNEKHDSTTSYPNRIVPPISPKRNGSIDSSKK